MQGKVSAYRLRKFLRLSWNQYKIARIAGVAATLPNGQAFGSEGYRK
jgi:hypothetical protein